MFRRAPRNDQPSIAHQYRELEIESEFTSQLNEYKNQLHLLFKRRNEEHLFLTFWGNKLKSYQKINHLYEQAKKEATEMHEPYMVDALLADKIKQSKKNELAHEKKEIHRRDDATAAATRGSVTTHFSPRKIEYFELRTTQAGIQKQYRKAEIAINQKWDEDIKNFNEINSIRAQAENTVRHRP